MTTRVVSMPRGSRIFRNSGTEVYIGRPSKWGNPFMIGRDGNRGEVIGKYRLWLATQPDLMLEAVATLKDKTLVCFCKPLPCHGDVLVELCDGAGDEQPADGWDYDELSDVDRNDVERYARGEEPD